MPKRKAWAQSSNEASRASKRAKHVEKKEPSMATIKAGRLVAALEKSLQKAAKPRDAVAMKKYMRNQFEYFGIKTPQRRAISTEVLSAMPLATPSDIHQTMELLWTKEQREFQQIAIDIAIKNKKPLSRDEPTATKTWEVVEKLIITKSWWDTVDMLACSVIGNLAQAYPARFHPTLDEWIKSKNMWLRRTAIIYQLSYNENTDEEILFRYCLECCDEKEFFIQKAIGWALRNYHRHNSKVVEDFVHAHTDRLAKLSVREALKHAK